MHTTTKAKPIAPSPSPGGFPELSTSPISCGSWIITTGDGSIYETYSRARALAAHRAGDVVATAYAHLAARNGAPPADGARGAAPCHSPSKLYANSATNNLPSLPPHASST
jgi:hypothetical protein